LNEVTPDTLQAMLQRFGPLMPLLDPNATAEQQEVALEALIDDGVRWLEDNANNLTAEKEDGLSTTLAGKISVPGLLRADRERNINGHVDIVIEVESVRPQRRWLAEAKCWGGPKYHVDGLKQLLGYTPGRGRSAYVFDYVRERDITTKWSGLKAHLEATPLPGQLGGCIVLAGDWRFESKHFHTSGKEVRVVHIGVNLFRSATSASGASQPAGDASSA
jgi:hypothetical protein